MSGIPAVYLQRSSVLGAVQSYLVVSSVTNSVVPGGPKSLGGNSRVNSGGGCESVCPSLSEREGSGGSLLIALDLADPV